MFITTLMEEKEKSLLVLYIFIDLIVLSVAMAALYAINVGDVQHLKYGICAYFSQGIVSWLLGYLFFPKKHLYLRDSYQHRVLRMLKRIFGFAVILAVGTVLIFKGDYSRIFTVGYLLLFFILELIVYKLIYIVLIYRRKQGKSVQRAVIVGYNSAAVEMKKMFDNSPLIGYKFEGFVRYAERNINDVPPEDLPCFLGDTENLEQILQNVCAEVMFSVYSPYQNEKAIRQQQRICQKLGIRLYLLPEMTRWLKKSKNIESLGKFFVINAQHIPLDDTKVRIIKRTFDIVVSAAVILFVFSWLFPVLAIIIKLSSKGPVFFVQERTGLNNRNFRCLKFRSMRQNDAADNVQATKGDARITKIGSFMRKHNIDELPQFINVFFGQMSLVGPRPHMLKHTQEYSALIDYYLTRHYVKPGITGWAQINGWRGETDELYKMEERVKFDMEYIENWKFLWDIKILWLTLFGKKTKENAF